MDSDWGVIDALLAELGSLRHETERLDGRGRDAVSPLMEQAAAAVTASVHDPESDALLVAACDAIVAARDEIGSATMAKLSGLPDPRASTLRLKSARILFERIRGGQDPWH